MTVPVTSSVNPLANYWKAITAAAGSILFVWNTASPGFASLLPPSWQAPIAVILAICTVLSTYAVPGPNYAKLKAQVKAYRQRGQHEC